MIIGHVGRDPEMRYTPSGRPVTTFTVATNRSWNSADGEHHAETEWFNVVTWGSLAEVCKQHLAKGHTGLHRRTFAIRRWEDAENTRHTSVEIVASEMMILGERRETNPNMNGEFLPSDEMEDEFPY